MSIIIGSIDQKDPYVPCKNPEAGFLVSKINSVETCLNRDALSKTSKYIQCYDSTIKNKFCIKATKTTFTSSAKITPYFNRINQKPDVESIVKQM